MSNQVPTEDHQKMSASEHMFITGAAVAFSSIAVGVLCAVLIFLF